MLVQAGFVLTIEPVSGLKILSQAPPRHAGRPKNGQRDGLGWAADDHNWALLVARGLSIARALSGQHRRLPNAGYAPGFST